MQNEIAILIPFFGKLPDYFPFFIATAEKNQFIDFLIFSDDKTALNYKRENIKIEEKSLKDFNQLATKKLENQIKFSNPYKLCDLKPMYGKVFEEYIVEYQFWGFADLDIVLGDLHTVFKNNTLEKYDIISFYKDYISGPFCLFRNINEVNNLFLKSKDYQSVINSDMYYNFDEVVEMEVLHQIWRGVPFLDATYSIESFSHVVLNPEKCTSRKFFKKIIDDAPLTNEKLFYEDGHLYRGNIEIALHHFIWNKQNFTFNVPNYIPSKAFYFTKDGFFYDNLKSKTLDRVESTVRNISRRVKKKIATMKNATVKKE